RAAQSAADAAALAASDELGHANDATCDSACLATLKTKAVAVAQSYLSKNGMTTSAAAFHECQTAGDKDCYTYPFGGNNARIEVRVKKPGTGYFARAMGVSIFDASARAVAIAKPSVIVNPGTPVAIFAYAHNGTDPCTGNDSGGVPYGITVGGNPTTAVDAVLSHGSVTVNTKGNVGWGGDGPPPLNCAPAGSQQANASTWAKQSSTIDWPKKFDRTAVCTGHDSNTARDLSGPADGIYCSTVSINVTHLSGNHSLTLVAPV